MPRGGIAWSGGNYIRDMPVCDGERCSNGGQGSPMMAREERRSDRKTQRRADAGLDLTSGALLHMSIAQLESAPILL